MVVNVQPVRAPLAARMETLRGVVLHWPAPDGRVVTARELVELANTDPAWRHALLAWCPPRRTQELPTPRSVGTALGAARGHEVAGYRLDIVKRAGPGAMWARLPSAR